MKLLKNTPLLLLLSLVFFSACSDSEETDGNFLCLPYAIANINLEYDSNNRIAKMTNNLTSIKTYSAFEYDAQGNLLEIRSYVSEDVKTTRRFSYSEKQVSIAITNVEGKDSTIIITLNDKQQALKRSDSKSPSTLSYEYDSKGNIIKTTNENDSVCNYTYDKKRGIFRELNMPQWFTNLAMPDLLNVKMGEHLDVYNNCLDIRTMVYKKPAKEGEKGKMLEVIVNSFVYKYNGFSYPYNILDRNMLAADIKYTPIE